MTISQPPKWRRHLWTVPNRLSSSRHSLPAVITRTISSPAEKKDRVRHVTQLTHTDVHAKSDNICHFIYVSTRAHLTAWQPRNELSFHINFHHRRVSLHIQIFIFMEMKVKIVNSRIKILISVFYYFVNEIYIRGEKKKVFNESRSFWCGRRHTGCLVWSVGSCAIKRKMREKNILISLSITPFEPRRLWSAVHLLNDDWALQIVLHVLGSRLVASYAMSERLMNLSNTANRTKKEILNFQLYTSTHTRNTSFNN